MDFESSDRVLEPEARVELPTLADVARRAAATDPGAPACRFDGHTTDYATFDTRANQVAHGLLQAGVEPGDRIAVLARNSDRYLEIAVGVVRARAALVALNWRLAAPELEYILDHSGARVLFAESDVPAAGQLARTVPARWWLDDAAAGPGYLAWRDGQPTRPVVPQGVSLDEDVVQMYTSGTTGRPKGVCLTHRNYLAAFHQASAYPWGAWGARERVFAPGPFFHVSGLNLALRALARGACVVTSATFQPEDLPRIIESEQITRTVMVPAVIQICVAAANAAATDFSSLKSVTYGGSPITQDLLARARAVLGCDFIQAYGLTESTGVATFLHPQDHLAAGARLASCGRCVPGTEVRVVDGTGGDCAHGVVGEVLLRGPSVMRSYWRDPQATAASVRDGWLHTGDAGYLDADGYLYIHDRIKDMIVSGGENVYPAEVENALADHPDVADVAVIGVPDPRWGEAVLALVVMCDGAAPDARALQAFARERIAGYKVPKTVEFVTALPRNAAGKILRRELRAPYWAGRERQVH